MLCQKLHRIFDNIPRKRLLSYIQHPTYHRSSNRAIEAFQNGNYGTLSAAGLAHQSQTVTLGQFETDTSQHITFQPRRVREEHVGEFDISVDLLGQTI